MTHDTPSPTAPRPRRRRPVMVTADQFFGRLANLMASCITIFLLVLVGWFFLAPYVLPARPTHPAVEAAIGDREAAEWLIKEGAAERADYEAARKKAASFRSR